MPVPSSPLSFFFFNDTATTEIYTLSLHDALPISIRPRRAVAGHVPRFSIPARCSTAQTRNEACIMTITRVTIAALVALLAAPRPAAGQEGGPPNALGLGAARQGLQARAARPQPAPPSADARPAAP